MRTTKTFNGVDENTQQERREIFIKVIAKNTYTGQIRVLEDELELELEENENSYEFFVQNIFYNTIKKFYTVEEAFAYRNRVCV